MSARGPGERHPWPSFYRQILIERIEIITIRAIKAEKKTIASGPGMWYNIHKRYKKDMKNKKNKKNNMDGKEAE